MLRNLRLRPTRSVAFQMQTYAVDTVRSRPLRHRLYGASNTGFRAIPTQLSATSHTTTNPRANPILDIEFSQRRFRKSDAFTIEFSVPFTNAFTDAEGLSGAFRVDVRLGEIIGFNILGNRLLIVQRFGFATLESAFDPSSFNLQTYAKSYEPIVDNTTQVLGDTIIFMTHGGMCRVQRNARVQLLDNIPVHNAVGGSWIQDNRYHIEADGKILVIEKFFDSWFYISNATTRCWESDNFMIGYAASRQFIKQIRLRTNANLTLTVLSESREQRIQIRARDRIQTLNVNLKGESFRLRIETHDPNTVITDLTAVIGFST